MSKPPKITVLFVDPYKREFRPVSLRNDLSTWYKALRCEYVEVMHVAHDKNTAQEIDLWFDEEFFLKSPLGPGFRFSNPEGKKITIYGYAFFCESNDTGDSVSMAEGALKLYPAFSELINLRWEPWEKRVGPNQFIEQQLRIPELEMSGDFNYLD